jgi:bisanhydrobacterioruberin hydratase
MKDLIQFKVINPTWEIIYRLFISNEEIFGLKEIFLLRIFIFGVIFNIIPQTREFASALSPLMLLIIGIYVLYPEFKKYETSFFMYVIIVFFTTIAIEAVGTATGQIFGSYYYGDVLGLQLFNVPIIIGLNWVVVILGTTYLASLITKNKFFLSIIAGLFAVIFDYFLEPNAVNLGYWTWQNGIIPLQNYIAWFFITFAFSLVYLYFFKLRETKRAGWAMVYQTGFFAILLIIL